MRRIVTILLLLCSLFSMAIVPPRDSSKREEWRQNVYSPGITQNRAPAIAQAVGSRTIIPRVLVIMTNFSNFELVSTKADVDSMFNGRNWTKDGATGSVRQYFYDQSMGAYDPQFDIVGPVTLDSAYAYYGSGCDKTARPGYMVLEACAKVDSEVDFSLYDSNNDGKVDLVYILFAGFGENDPPASRTLVPVVCDLPWPHFWNVVTAGTGQNSRIFDGKYIYEYEISNELDGRVSTDAHKVIAGIGVMCHEFGHALGLPDLYNYSHNEKTVGMWDIMDYGPYNNNMHTPPSYSAYERFFMGWLTPTLITDSDNLQLEHIATSNKAYLISESDTHNFDGVHPDPSTFYLLENRQRTGWDCAVPGPGMLLTKINNPAARWSSMNKNPNDFGVDIIEADGLAPAYVQNMPTNGYFGKPGDVFPCGATEYLGIPDHAITDITMADGIVSFKYRGGKQQIDPTGITQTVSSSDVCKSIVNGQLLIHAGGNTYSVLGIRINE